MLESTEASPLHSPADSLVALPPNTTRARLRRSRSTLSPSKIALITLPTKTDPSVYLTVRSGSHTALGAFSPTPDAQSSLEFFAAPKRRRPSIPPPPIPIRAQTIPSISRTASSSFSIPAGRSPASALLDFDRGYATPRPIPPPSPAPQSGTAPALASLERRSRFCARRVFCATCRAPGSNFPACARCGAAWCSRACRLPNGARHVCPSAASGADAPAPLSRTGISSPPVPISPARISIPSPR